MSDPRLTRPLWRGRTNVDAYTIAWIEHAEQIKRQRWPSRPELHHLYDVTQGGYQGSGGDPDSAGSHALGGGTDFHWCGHPECLLALRLAGGFAWHRTPAQGPWPDHIHGAPLGHPFMAPLLISQQADYLAHPPLNGLANNGPDDGPRLDPIPRPVWPWPPPPKGFTVDKEAAQRFDSLEQNIAALRDAVASLRQKEAQRFVKEIKEQRAQGKSLDAILSELEKG